MIVPLDLVVAFAGSVYDLGVLFETTGLDLNEWRAVALTRELELFACLHEHVDHVIASLHRCDFSMTLRYYSLHTSHRRAYRAL